MAVSLLRRMAARAPVPVYAAVGCGAALAVERLALSARLLLAPSPRKASVLLVAGPVREADRDALRRLHDQLPHPRATLWWGCAPLGGTVDPATLALEEDAADALVALHRALFLGQRHSEPDLCPDAPPSPWRGRGDHGQGGEGMMGGTPYGRAMAMTADDLRDGLALDAFPFRLGPFAPMLPPGLVLALTLQGDVVQEASIERPPCPSVHDAHVGDGPELGARAEAGLVLARLLRVLGLGGLARRCAGVATGMEPPRMLHRRIVASGAQFAIPPRLGMHRGEDVRARFRRALETLTAESDPEPTVGEDDVRLVDLLVGLEWNEAMLVLASFDAATLARIAPAAGSDDDADAHAPRRAAEAP